MPPHEEPRKRPLTVATWPNERRRVPRESDPDSDPGNATSPDFHVHLPRRVTGKQIAAIVTSLLALLGSGWYAKEKLSVEPQVVMVSAAWQKEVDRQIADLRLRFEGLLSEVRQSTDETRNLRADLRAHMIVGLNRERWLAKQAGDPQEVDRIQKQIDQLEGRGR